MSTFSMGIAGSVAQGAVQAGQVSKAQHRARTDQAADARKVREKLSEHFEAVEEGDEANLVSNVRVDEDVPQHDRHAQREKGKGHEHAAADTEATLTDEAAPDDSAPTSPAPSNRDLYRHVDITA